MSGNRTDATLTTDIYDIAAFVDKIKSKYIDIPEDTLAMGIYGYLSEIFSNSIENATIMASEYANEASPVKAKFERNILAHALSLGINSIRATPASMQVFLCFPEKELIDNMQNDYFIFDKNYPIYIGNSNNYEYHTDYDIIIHHNLLPSGKYTFTATYDITDKEKNEVTDITNPYLPAIGVMSTGQSNMVMVPALIRQVQKDTEYKTVLINNPLENKTMTFSFKDQLAYFTVTVTEGDTVHHLTPVYDGLTDTSGGEFCNYIYLDAETIRLTFNRDSYQPRANANIVVNIYTTKGSECNFSYNTDKICKLSSDRFAYDPNLWMFIRPVTDSEYGKDRDTVEEIKRKIPKQMLMRGSVTTVADLNNYFNFLNNDNRHLYFLEKVHNQVERIYYSYLLMKKDGNIIPTNTIDVMVTREMFSNINAVNYVLQPGSTFFYDPDGNTEICESIPKTDHDKLMSLDKNGFLYMNPFLTLINKNPFFTQYYLNILDYTKSLNFDYINSNSEVQFIATKINVKRQYYTDRDTYKINMTLEQNVAEDFALVNLNNEEQITQCLVTPIGVVYDNGKPVRYIVGKIQAFDRNAYTYDFQFKFKTSDLINRTNKIAITGGMYETGTNTEALSYLPRNIEIKFFILAKLNTEYGRGDEIDKLAPGYDGYTLCNCYTVYSGVDLYYDYTDLMTSYTTLYQNENKTFSYIIRKMPMIRYAYIDSEDRIRDFVRLLETNKIYLESALALLEDSFGVDFKFFNTYGPSKLYNIDKSTLLNKTNLSLTFEVKFVMASDSYITSDITKDIKEYLEDINEINDLHMPNLITYITNKYRNQIVYFKFIDLNGYGPVRQSIYKEDIDAYLESSTVPEFLNVNTLLPSNDPDIKYNIVV